MTIPKRLLALLSLVSLLGLWVLVPAHNAAAQTPNPGTVNASAEIAAIDDLLQQSMYAYQHGDKDAAFKLSRAAYLDHFENIEIPLRVMDGDLTAEMEFRFADLRTLMQAGAPSEQVEAKSRSVRDGLTEVDRLLGNGPGVVAPLFALLTSFSIIFREGLEAALVVAAVLAYLEASNMRRLKRPVLLGVAGGVAVSAIAWVLINTLITLAPVGREVLEAIVSIVAVVTLFWVSFWLLRKLDNKRWMEFIKARTWAAMTAGSTGALAMLGFTAVFREGLETALFYQVLTLVSTGIEWAVLLGFVLGVVAISGCLALMFRLGRKLPVKTFLGAAATIIMVLSVAFLGNAVRELQDIGLINATSLIGLVPRLPRLLAELTGIHPTLETLGAQAVLTLVYLGGWVYMRVSGNKTAPVRQPVSRNV